MVSSAVAWVSKAGGITSIVGSAPDRGSVLIIRPAANNAMYAATCTGCGIQVAACSDASVPMFALARIAQPAFLSQAMAEVNRRAQAVIGQGEAEGLVDCSNHGECEAVCAKEISIEHLDKMRRSTSRRC